MHNGNDDDFGICYLIKDIKWKTVNDCSPCISNYNWIYAGCVDYRIYGGENFIKKLIAKS